LQKAVQYFIPTVLSIAICSSLYWLFIAHQPISFAITVFATILVVSCPCAFRNSYYHGNIIRPRVRVLIKGGQYLEKLSSIDTIISIAAGLLYGITNSLILTSALAALG
jgi:P-type E1-E2 ATPase